MESAEKYAISEEQKQLQWEAKFRNREANDYERVNLLLEQQQYQELLRLYEKEKYGEFYGDRSSFTSMNLAMKVFQKEHTLENHIFWNIKSITMLEEKIRRLKFWYGVLSTLAAVK